MLKIEKILCIVDQLLDEKIGVIFLWVENEIKIFIE
jgi:hypothetical protein